MTNKDKQDREFKIPMEVTPETIRDFEIDPKNVTWTRIGNKPVKVVWVPCTETEYYEFMRPLWREDKNAQNREPMESLEKMAEDLSFEPGTSGSMEDDVTAEMLLEELIRYLDGVKPGYGGIFRMLYEGYESADIQKEYDLKKSTANYQIRRIRELAAKYISE